MKIKNWIKIYNYYWENMRTRLNVRIKEVDKNLYRAYAFPAKSFKTIWISVRPMTLTNSVNDAVNFMKKHI